MVLELETDGAMAASHYGRMREILPDYSVHDHLSGGTRDTSAIRK